MSVVAVIPARYASTRFPAKALAAETGKYLIQHVYEQAKRARRLDRVVIATDDDRIAKAVKSFDGQFVMTRADHVSGTDRVGEAAAALHLADDDIVLNIQGDEPEISPDSLDALVERMSGGSDEATERRSDEGERHAGTEARRHEGGNVETSKRRNVEIGKVETDPFVASSLRRSVTQSRISQVALIGTIASPFDDSGPREGPGSPLDPNCVKVVVDESGRAMYFSRSPIPYPRDHRGVIDRPSRWLLHIGVYAFRMAALKHVTGLPPVEIERTESLEQLRWLHNGLPIEVVVVNERSVGIDTPEDYAAFVARYRAANRAARVVV